MTRAQHGHTSFANHYTIISITRVMLCALAQQMSVAKQSRTLCALHTYYIFRPILIVCVRDARFFHSRSDQKFSLLPAQCTAHARALKNGARVKGRRTIYGRVSVGTHALKVWRCTLRGASLRIKQRRAGFTKKKQRDHARVCAWCIRT